VPTLSTGPDGHTGAEVHHRQRHPCVGISQSRPQPGPARDGAHAGLSWPGTTRASINRGGVGVGSRGNPRGAPRPAVNSPADHSSHNSRLWCGASSSCWRARAGP
jgi:hypothetical protein